MSSEELNKISFDEVKTAIREGREMGDLAEEKGVEITLLSRYITYRWGGWRKLTRRFKRVRGR